MKKQSIIGELRSHDQTTLEACESLIVGLNNRRFVVVRKDAPSSLRPVAEDATEGDWPKLERLRAGDQVFYKGKKAMIRAIDRYR